MKHFIIIWLKFHCFKRYLVVGLTSSGSMISQGGCQPPRGTNSLADPGGIANACPQRSRFFYFYTLIFHNVATSDHGTPPTRLVPPSGNPGSVTPDMIKCLCWNSGRSNGTTPSTHTPEGANSFISTHKFYKMWPHWELVPPSYEILDLPL